MDKKVLLIADDDKMNRMIISKFLGEDYNVIEAVDGKQAIAILTSTHIDILLLDIIMPEMDGFEVLKEIKGNKELEHIGILVATSTKEKTERTALSLGADDIVSKPYDPVVITKRLANILARKELSHRLELGRNADNAALQKEQLLTFQADIDGFTSDIRQCIRLISANKDNAPLITEMLTRIGVQLDELDKIAYKK
ncbi:MAG: response regulator [Fibrobacter sp.]|nr:response regulator [Fibrobacter sp.]